MGCNYITLCHRYYKHLHMLHRYRKNFSTVQVYRGYEELPLVYGWHGMMVVLGAGVMYREGGKEGGEEDAVGWEGSPLRKGIRDTVAQQGGA